LTDAERDSSYDDLDFRSQEAIIDLLVSIIKNTKKEKPEDK